MYSATMQWISSLIANLSTLGIAGYGLIFLLSFAEAFIFTGLFVPGSVAVIIAGGLSAQGVYGFWYLMIFTIIGAVLGDAASYELGRRGQTYVERHPWLHRQVEKGRPFFDRHRGKSIFLGRFVGWVRPIVPFIAGIVRMNRRHFYTMNTTSAILWSFAYLGLGYIFGAAWKFALLWVTRAGFLLLLFAILLFLFVWAWKWVLRRGNSVLVVLKSIALSVLKGLQANPYLSAWSKRHTGLIAFVHARFTTRQFTGLPLTLLAFAFLLSVTTLSGIIEDYLSRDTITLLDTRLSNLLFAFRQPQMLQFFYFITLFALVGLLLAAAIAASAFLLYRKQYIYASTLWLNLLMSMGLTFFGKLLFHRARPDLLIRAVTEDSFSFPSGHATAAAAFYGFIAYLIIRTNPSWKIKVGAFFSTIGLVFLIDFSRLYLGVHYLSDVIAGNLVSLSVLLFSISVTEWLLSRSAKSREYTLRTGTVIGMLALETVAVAVLFFAAPPPFLNAAKPAAIPVSTTKILPLFSSGSLPQFTETIIGTKQEPINVIVVGTSQCLTETMKRSGWYKADVVSLGSLKKTAMAAMNNGAFSTAPITPYFYDARPHDLGFEKQTEKQSVRSRHHVRFWQTNYQTASGAVFVGTVSLDTGIKWGITHSIAPDIDTARGFLVHDLEKSGMITSSQYLPLVSPTLGENFTGDAFFTDGKATLLNLRSCP